MNVNVCSVVHRIRHINIGGVVQGDILRQSHCVGEDGGIMYIFRQGHSVGNNSRVVDVSCGILDIIRECTYQNSFIVSAP